MNEWICIHKTIKMVSGAGRQGRWRVWYWAGFWLSAWAPAPKSTALCSLLSETFAPYNGTALHSDDLKSCPGKGWEQGARGSYALNPTHRWLLVSPRKWSVPRPPCTHFGLSRVGPRLPWRWKKALRGLELGNCHWLLRAPEWCDPTTAHTSARSPPQGPRDPGQDPKRVSAVPGSGTAFGKRHVPNVRGKVSL